MGNKREGDEILERIRAAGVRAIGEPTEVGFTEYVVSRKAEHFFAS